MPEEIMDFQNELQKLKKQYPDFFKQIPAALLQFITAETTLSKINNLCVETGVKNEEQIEKIAYWTVMVLLNQISKEELRLNLIRDVVLDSATANQIYLKLEELIFSQAPKVEFSLTPILETEEATEEPFYHEPETITAIVKNWGGLQIAETIKDYGQDFVDTYIAAREKFLADLEKKTGDRKLALKEFIKINPKAFLYATGNAGQDLGLTPPK